MSDRYDAIVLGVGGMGSAALYHLARRGKKVLGLERFQIPHERGSSHGLTRIIRLAYYEHPSYVPLLLRAYELWRELEGKFGTQLLHITGSIDAGPPDSSVFEGSRQSCEIHDLNHEVLTSKELTARFPGYRLPASTMAVLQPDGGFLVPESCISAHVALAQAIGAEVHTGERVLSWDAAPSGVAVKTDHGRYEAERLIISAGAWISQFVPELCNKAIPERQVVAWLEPFRPEWFRSDNFPVFNLAVDEGRYYGFPVFGIPGFKVGRYHHREQRYDPDNPSRECDGEDERILRQFAERYFPDGCGSTLSMQACLFTNTPDEHFVIDSLPDYPRVIVASPCSGHGFKFASVIGEILADMVECGEARHDISMLRLARLTEKTREQKASIINPNEN
jgi:sarcosine oxidase